jgi:hypothetical protein
VYLLWCAACILGIKYEQTAVKVHAAVCEANVASRKFYQKVYLTYSLLFVISFLVFIYWMIAYVLVFTKGGSWNIFIVGGIFCMILVLCLSAAYL